MDKLSNYTNEEIKDLIMIETAEEAEKILNNKFPNSEIHHLHIFSNGDFDLKIDERHIIGKTKIL